MRIEDNFSHPTLILIVGSIVIWVKRIIKFQITKPEIVFIMEWFLKKLPVDEFEINMII